MLYLIALIVLIANFFILSSSYVKNNRFLETIFFFPLCNLLFFLLVYLPIYYTSSFGAFLYGLAPTIYLLYYFYRNLANKHNALVVPVCMITSSLLFSHIMEYSVNIGIGFVLDSFVELIMLGTFIVSLIASLIIVFFRG